MAFGQGLPARLDELEARLVALEEAASGIVNRLHVGAGDPPVTLGVDGDFYIDRANGSFLQKLAGVWSPLGQFWLDPGLAGA